MTETAHSALPMRFGAFEFDSRARQVRKHGHAIRLHGQPLEILGLLLERPTEVVLREELRAKLWPEDTFVDFEHSLNAAVNKLREALGDDANNPRFIETVPRRGYRFIGPVEVALLASAPESANQDAPAVPPMPRRLRWAVTTASFVLLGLLVVGTSFWIRSSRLRWARNQALPEIARLVDQGKIDQAFRLTQETERYIPNDPLLERLVRSFTVPVSLQTTSPGAEIYMRTYSSAEEGWTFLGKSPLENVRVPWDYFRWRIVEPGFGTFEVASGVLPNATVNFLIDAADSIPEGMVHVPGGTFQYRSADSVELAPYWLDKYEVTNQRFSDFMKRGGYQDQTYWQHEFIRDGHAISWEDAMAQFRDSTGRPGPSTWELGSYPQGQADFPVSGVSWYEAAAYCESVAKSLPTIFHWYKAAGLGIDSEILHFSNFSGKGPARTGVYQGLGPFGNYDMAGNVKEWAWNETGGKRYILGGAWNEPSYTFATQEAQPPFSRTATSGFRCVKYTAPVSASLTGPVTKLARDYTKEKPAAESVFVLYKSLYSYDRTELDARVESIEDSSDDWKREKITFRAAYGNERVTAYLFLPRNALPPYSVLVYFPGVSSFFRESSSTISPDRVSFAVKSGRAVLYPIYTGTYERRISTPTVRQTWDELVQPGGACLPVGPNAGRDLVVQWAKDIQRAIDYLETRRDIDSQRLAFYGLSLGAVWGPVMTAVEPRFKASVLVAGGLPFEKLPSEIEPLNFAPRVRVPTLMLNGRDDFMFPVNSSQLPLFRLLGVPERQKRHVLFDSGHVPPANSVMKESLDWLDRYLGPAVTAKVSPETGFLPLAAFRLPAHVFAWPSFAEAQRKGGGSRVSKDSRTSRR